MCEVYKDDHKHIKNRIDNEETSTGNYKLDYKKHYTRLKNEVKLLSMSFLRQTNDTLVVFSSFFRKTLKQGTDTL
jgi:hypothetical protein